jgi:hypothetical protein
VNLGKILVLSLCANAALAGMLVSSRGKPTGASVPAAPATGFGIKPIATELSAAATQFVATACVTNRFHWRMIESEDYDEYVAHLRAAGCPEKTIRDIIVADVERVYAARRAAARVQGSFWVTGNSRRRVERAQEEKLEALKKEQEELIQRLLGIEWSAEGDRELEKLEDQALWRFLCGPMSEDSFQRVTQLIAKYDALKGEVEHHCAGIRLDEDDAQLERLYRQMVQELASVLTPMQLEEMKARVSAFGLFAFNPVSVEGVDVTAAEVRQIALAKAAAGAKLFGWPEDETDEDTRAKEEQFQNALRNLLGDKRYADFERAQDREFRTLSEISKDEGLPKETAVKVYDMHPQRRFAGRIGPAPAVRGNAGGHSNRGCGHFGHEGLRGLFETRRRVDNQC